MIGHGVLMDIKPLNFRRVDQKSQETSLFQDNVEQVIQQANVNQKVISDAIDSDVAALEAFEATFTSGTTWTPTGSWSANTTYTGFYQRVRNIGNFAVYITLAGAPTAAVLTINLPAGLTIDTSYLLATNPGMIFKSAVTLKDTSASFWHSGGVSYATTTTVEIDVYSTPTLYLRLTGVTNLIPVTFANTDWIKIEFEAPILEWR